MAEITTNGVRFHVQRLAPHRADHLADPVQPVVFVHGLCFDNLSSIYFTLATPVARAGADVIMYDHRGHGQSERPRTGYRVSDSVADLAAILDALDVDIPVHLVGHSYGGAIALSFALAYPERVASVVLIEAHVPIRGWAEKLAASLMKTGLDLVEETRRMAPKRNGARLLGRAKDLISHTTLVTDLMATEPLSEQELRMFTRPVRAVYGEHSDVLHHAHLLDGLLPQYTLTILPGLDHFVLGKATRVLQAIVLEWFAGQTTAGVR